MTIPDRATDLIFLCLKREDISTFASIPTTGLDPGQHLLSVRIQEATGEWSITRTQPFYLNDSPTPPPPADPNEIVALEYFFDENDPGPGNGTAIPVTASGAAVAEMANVDVTGLSPGAHTPLYVRAMPMAAGASPALRCSRLNLSSQTICQMWTSPS